MKYITLLYVFVTINGPHSSIYVVFEGPDICSIRNDIKITTLHVFTLVSFVPSILGPYLPDVFQILRV